MGVGLFASMSIFCMAAATESSAVIAGEGWTREERPGVISAPTIVASAAASSQSPLPEAAPAALEDAVSLPAVVFGEESDEAVVDRIRAYLESIDTLSASFVQTAPSGALATGKLYLRRPGQARFQYDPPSPLLIVATQGNVYVEDTALGQTDLYPIRQTPLRFLLSRKVDLADARVISVKRGADSVAVTFASSDASTEGDLSLVLAAPQMQLREWIVRDPQNRETVVSLVDPVLGARLENRLFRAPEAGGAFINN